MIVPFILPIMSFFGLIWLDASDVMRSTLHQLVNQYICLCLIKKKKQKNNWDHNNTIASRFINTCTSILYNQLVWTSQQFTEAVVTIQLTLDAHVQGLQQLRNLRVPPGKMPNVLALLHLCITPKESQSLWTRGHNHISGSPYTTTTTTTPFIIVLAATYLIYTSSVRHF